MQTAQLFLPIAAAVLSVFAMGVAWLLGGRKASWVVAGCLVFGALALYVTADRKDDAVFGIMAVLSFGSVVLVPQSSARALRQLGCIEPLVASGRIRSDFDSCETVNRTHRQEAPWIGC